MVFIKYKQQFPCGYSVDLEAKGFGLDVQIDYDKTRDQGCPLHGKKCSNGKKTPKDN